MSPRAELVRITPRMAKEWLELNVRNRPIKKTQVARYTRDIEAGAWRVNGETIKFALIDGEDKLVDGQNRLKGIERADRYIDTFVVWGLDYDQVMPTIDTGTARTFGDTLKLRGEKNWNQLAACTRLIYVSSLKRASAFSFQPSTSELLDFLNLHPDVRDAASRAAKVASGFPIRIPAFAGAIFFGNQLDPEVVDLFAERVRTGEGLVSGDPAYVLRKWIINARAATRQPVPLHWIAVTNRAMITALEGRAMSALKWSPAHAFPYIQDAEIITS